MSELFQVSPAQRHNDIKIISSNGCATFTTIEVPSNQELPNFSGLYDVCNSSCNVGLDNSSISGIDTALCLIQAIYPYGNSTDYREEFHLLRDWSSDGDLRDIQTGWAINPESSGYIDLQSNVDMTGIFSISLNFKVDGSIATDPLVANSGNDDGLILTNSTSVEVDIGGSSQNFTVPAFSGWNHIAVTRDGSDDVRVFLNDTESSSGALGLAGSLTINRLSASDSLFSSHLLFDVRLYDRELSSTEINRLNNECLATSTALDTIGHWKLDETEGSGAYDSSGNSNIGTHIGTINWYSGNDVPYSWHNDVGYSV